MVDRRVIDKEEGRWICDCGNEKKKVRIGDVEL